MKTDIIEKVIFLNIVPIGSQKYIKAPNFYLFFIYLHYIGQIWLNLLMITTLCLSQKDQGKTLVLGESVGMEEGAIMNVNTDDFFMKKFQDFIQKHVNGHWVAYGISSSLSGVQEYFMLRSS